MLSHYVAPLIATECIKMRSDLHLTPICVVFPEWQMLCHCVTWKKKKKTRAGGMSHRGLLRQGLSQGKWSEPCLWALQGCGGSELGGVL